MWYLDKETVADVTDLHRVGVCLPDVLLHLQAGPAVQGELSFLLQGHNGGGSLSGPFLLGTLSPLHSHSPRPRKVRRPGHLHPCRFSPTQPTGVHTGPSAEPQVGTRQRPERKSRTPNPNIVPLQMWVTNLHSSPHVRQSQPTYNEDTEAGKGGSLPKG